MLRLDLSREPRWYDLGSGVRVRARPVGSAIMMAARAEQGMPDPDAGPEAYAYAFARALARLAILDWEGVGDADGAPAPVTADTVEALMDVWPVFERWQAVYVTPGLLLDAEKNASAPSPNGTSAGAPTTARPARRTAKRVPRG